MVAGKEVTRMTGMQSASQIQTALAIDPAGPLFDTRSTAALRDIPAPRTRLAPVQGRTNIPPQQSFVSQNSVNPRSELESPSRSPVQQASLQSEPMPSMLLADAVQRAQAATVRLRVHDGHGYGAGTGTIIDTHGEEALVLTCGHLFRENKGQGKIEVDLFVGGQTRTVSGEVIDYDADTRDTALVVIRPGLQIQPIQVEVRNEKVRNGETAFSFGCDRGDDPSRRDTRISGINKYNQHLGVSNLEIQGAPIDGRSGGGLFNAAGNLIGICNAADYKNDVGIYAGPGSVQWQLDRVGLSKLYESALDAPAPAVSPPAMNPPAERIAAAVPRTPVSNVRPASASARQTSGGQEVIVIVRDRNAPQDTSRVMTLHEPTADLMQMIESQSR